MELSRDILNIAIDSAATLIGSLYMPPLTKKDMDFRWFKKFLLPTNNGGWGVGRTIRQKELLHESIRADLLTDLESVYDRDAAAQLIEDYTNSRLADFSSKGNATIISAISKIGAFSQPLLLAPVDQFAFKGVKKEERKCNKKILPGSRPHHRTYKKYNQLFFDLSLKFEEELIHYSDQKERIISLSRTNQISVFMLRVFDNYLMYLGGRSVSPIKHGSQKCS